MKCRRIVWLVVLLHAASSCSSREDSVAPGGGVHVGATHRAAMFVYERVPKSTVQVHDVEAWCLKTGYSFQVVKADRREGYDRAMQEKIGRVPTVVLYDSNNVERARYDGPAEIRELLMGVDRSASDRVGGSGTKGSSASP